MLPVLTRNRWLAGSLIGLLALGQLAAVVHGAEHSALLQDLTCPLCLAADDLDAAAIEHFSPVVAALAVAGGRLPATAGVRAGLRWYLQRAPPPTHLSV